MRTGLIILGIPLFICVVAMVSIIYLEYTESKEEIVTSDGGFEEIVKDYEEPTEEEFSHYNFIFPIAKEDFRAYTSPFGIRVSPFTGKELYHKGLDIAGVWRSQIVAIADGVVIEHYPPPGTVRNGIRFRGHEVYGGMIILQHEDGSRSLYAHLHSTRVTTGQLIRAGEVIGRMGNTGLSRGDHLHIEIIINGEPVNPLLYLPEFTEEEL